MYSFFIDESGLPRLDKICPSSPYFIMGGVIIKNEELDKIRQKINQFKIKELITISNTPENVKLHASAIFNCREAFSGQKKEVCQEIANKFYQEMTNYNITIIATCIEKQKLIDCYKETAQDPYPLAWLYCCERFNYHLKDNKSTNEKGRTYLEKRGPGLDKLYLGRLNNFLSMGTKYRWLPYVESPIFKTCNEEPLLTLADFACYAVHKLVNKNEPKLFDLIKNKFRGAPEKIEGYGLVKFPK